MSGGREQRSGGGAPAVLMKSQQVDWGWGGEGRAGSRQMPIPQCLAASGMAGAQYVKVGKVCPLQKKEGGRITMKTMKLEVLAGPAQRTDTAGAAVPRAGVSAGGAQESRQGAQVRRG